MGSYTVAQMDKSCLDKEDILYWFEKYFELKYKVYDPEYTDCILKNVSLFVDRLLFNGKIEANERAVEFLTLIDLMTECLVDLYDMKIVHKIELCLASKFLTIVFV